MDDRERKPVERRAPLSSRQKLLMLTILVRRSAAFETAREQLQPKHFGDNALEYHLIWQTTLAFYEEHGELPGRDEMMAELQALLADDPTALDADEIDRMDGLVDDIYSTPRKSLKVTVGLSYLQRFLHDRLTERMRTLFRPGGATPLELGEHLVDAVEQTQRIDTLRDMPVDEPFPEGWNETPPVAKTMTGFPWMDTFLNGGDAPNEVYTLAAPFGTCKTLIGVMLSTRAARMFDMEYARDSCTGKPVLKLSYHITYEEPAQSLRVRALSYIGMIHRTHLESGRVSDLSTPDNLHKYERDMNRFAGWQCEQSRFALAQKWLNFNWRLVDFTGQIQGLDHMGHGGIPEVAQFIRRDLVRQKRKRGVECAAGKIILDYAGIACKRYLDAKNILQSQELRHKMGQFPYDAKRMLAARFNCPVYLFAQLSGSAAGLGAGVVCKKTDTAENKLLLENADFGITIGNMTGDNMAVASLQKARRGKCPRHSVIKVNGAMCRVEDMDANMVYFERGSRIMTKQELMQIDAGTGGTHRSAVGGYLNGEPSRRVRSVRRDRRAMTD